MQSVSYDRGDCEELAANSAEETFKSVPLTRIETS
jgi:hypothetical protein